ncbi:MAG: hypothetical protein B7Y26_07445 [Hydrogenophilales bacterium 16-64-46]|nr:MAG: hypothetical protein B7Z32_07985 [Hydrogenophilales bacterium 12-64-13]OYZ05583.1 MAG: hypothetical protein B7Y26_07445 [Hydrogenophilales bacterium 16-64-46]OZA40163.1 MAG: hypothetical protein B7X87_00825 [Hydrogenophilales bacterium 17-64-34]HQT00440.1 DUF1841 family protein [Thiobacillus sp.]
MFNPSRDQVRQFFFDVWAKYRAGQRLAGAEAPALEIVLAHPEYHALLDAPDRHLDRDYPPEAGETNPFLHLSLHLALAEQLGIDQPPGLRARYQKLLARHGDAMPAQHAAIDCLAETVWRAQRDRAPFDATGYLNCLDRQISG